MDWSTGYTLDSAMYRAGRSGRIDVSTIYDGIQLSFGRLRNLRIVSSGMSKSLP